MGASNYIKQFSVPQTYLQVFLLCVQFSRLSRHENVSSRKNTKINRSQFLFLEPFKHLQEGKHDLTILPREHKYDFTSLTEKQ